MKTFLNYITDIEELQQNLICIKEDKTNKTKYFFNTILFFTNERDSSKNKTLKKLEEAVEDTNINIIPLVAEEVHYVVKDDKILINDDKTSIVINEQSNVDTICIVRLGAQDSEECCECIKEIQDWGIFTLNPIQSAKKASNKYTTAVLLNRYDIPQPKYTLVCKNDIEKGLESLSKKLKDITASLPFLFRKLTAFSTPFFSSSSSLLTAYLRARKYCLQGCPSAFNSFFGKTFLMMSTSSNVVSIFFSFLFSTISLLTLLAL